MRMMMKVNIPVEAGNAAIKNGTLAGTLKKILDLIKPEATYFTEENGERTAMIFFDMKDTSEIPAVAEPAFLAFGAKVHFRPVMNLQDLMAGAPGMEQAVKLFG